MPYKIIGKIISGIEVKKLKIEDEDTNEISIINYDDCIKLARMNKISNANAILSIKENKYIINVANGLNNIETVNDESEVYTPIGRMIKNSECIGYSLKNSFGKVYKISIKKTWDLAQQGQIKGIKGIIINGHKVLKSTDEANINDLPVIRT